MSKENNEIVILLDGYLQEHNQGWMKYPKCIARTSKLTPREREIWAILYSYAGDHGIFPSLDRIANDLNKTRRSIIDTIGILEEKKFISKKRRGFGLTNTYKLNVPKSVIEEYEENMETYRKKEYITPNMINGIELIARRLGNKYWNKVIENQIKVSKEIYKINHVEYNIAQLIMNLDKHGTVGVFNSSKENILKMVFSFIKHYKKIPTNQEVDYFDSLLEEVDITTLVNAIEISKKEKREVIDCLEEGQKQKEKIKNSFAKSNYNKNKENNNTSSHVNGGNPYDKDIESLFD